jgi:hypothetical protein
MSEKTKEQLLKEEAAEACLTPTGRLLVMEAMQAYADQEKRSTATNFLVWCRRRAKELESNPLAWGEFDRLCSDQKYNLYINSL